MSSVLDAIWQALNSPVGIAALAALALWLLNRIYRRFPTWQRYEGVIVRGIRFAEGQIPDTTPNKALAKLDAALKYVLRVYADLEGRPPPKREISELRAAIQAKHGKLDQNGGLKAGDPDDQSGTG